MQIARAAVLQTRVAADSVYLPRTAFAQVVLYKPVLIHTKIVYSI